MEDSYQELTLKEREKLHEDIERIRLVLQTDTNELYGESEDGVNEVSNDEPVLQRGDEDEETAQTLFTQQQAPSISDIVTPVQDGATSREDFDLSHFEYGDELPANAEVALALNRAYQEVIEENLKRVKLVLIHNRERQSQLDQEIQNKSNEDIYANDQYKKKLLTVYCIPYFKDVNGMFPPKNEDTVIKKANGDPDPFIRPPKIFLNEFMEKMRESVTADAKQKLMIPLVNKKEILCEKLYGDEKNDSIREAIKDIDDKVEEIKYLSLAQLLELRGENEADIDWMKISTMDFDGIRTSEELKRSWHHFIHPRINTRKFKTLEDSKLMELAEKYQYRNWEQIALDLGTNRTAFQCLQRYQMKLNPDLKTGKWTAEEDDILKEVVQQCCLPNGQIDWTNVSYFMDGRSSDMCQERWESVNPCIGMKKGKWTDEEDLKLLTAVQIYGQQWAKMEKFVPGRTGTQIRERYFNAFEGTKKGEWTYEEDRFIWLQVVKHGPGHWAQIAKQLQFRSDNAVAQRYRRLLKWGELSTTLGCTNKTAYLEVLMRKTKDIRLDVPNTAKMTKGAEHREKESRKSSNFLDQTLMFHEALDKGNVNLDNEIKSKSLFDRISKEMKKFEHHKSLENLMKPKKSFEERNLEKELNEKIEKDIQKGIFIPRPPPGVDGTRRYCSILQERINMQKRMKEIISKSVLKNCRLKEDQLNKNVEDILHGHNIKEFYVCHLYAVPAILHLFSINGKFNAIKQLDRINFANIVTLLQRIENKWRLDGEHGRHCRRMYLRLTPHGTNKNEILDQVRVKSLGKMLTVKEILDLSTSIKTKVMKTHGETTQNVSEDQKVEQKISEIMNASKIEHLYIPGNLRNTLGKQGMFKVPEQSKDMKIRVSKLMLAALNVDVKGCISTAKKMQSGSRPKSWHSRKEKIEKTIAKLSSVTGVPIKKCMSEDSDSEETTDAKRKTLPKLRALSGDGATVYHIPPLPPNCETLKAFKNMLIHRKKLVNIAGKYHIPGSLTTGKIESKLSSDNGAGPVDSSPEKSNLEEVLPSIPKSEIINDEEKCSSDKLDPSNLSGQYMARDLLAAKKIIQTRNVTELKEGSMSVSKFQDVMESDPVICQDKTNKPKLRTLEKLRKTHDYHLLNARFKSAFLWPALLSTIPVDRFTIPKPCKKKGNKKMKFYSARKTKKRKTKKGTETESSNLNQTESSAINELELSANNEAESTVIKESSANNEAESTVIKESSANNEAETTVIKEEDTTTDVVDSKLNVIEQVQDVSAMEEISQEPATEEVPVSNTPTVKRRGRPKGGGKCRFEHLKSTHRTSERKRTSRTVMDFSDDYLPRKKRSNKITPATKNIELRDAILHDYVRPPSKRLGRKHLNLANDTVYASPQIQVKGEPVWSESDYGRDNHHLHGSLFSTEHVLGNALPGTDQDIIDKERNSELGSISNNEQLLPCILVGNQLIPLNHPLLHDFVKSVKAMSTSDQSNTNITEVSTE